VRDWNVVGGLIESDACLLLVGNRRNTGELEWTPPGGVVDLGESSLVALTREVEEETSLEVREWSSCVYKVFVDFPEREMRLFVEVFRAVSWDGELSFVDPDRIVESGRFVDSETAMKLLSKSPQWVSEPLLDWLAGNYRVDATYAYLVDGETPKTFRVKRL